MATDEEQGLPDTKHANPARMYDYYLGGTHNFEADRDAAKAIVGTSPTTIPLSRANRSFLRRAVETMSAAGITQYLDLGSGVPTVGNVHEIAQRANPEARVVYVDREPVAAETARRLLAANQRASIVRSDLRDVAKVFESAGELLDFTQPVGLLMVAVLHFIPTADDPLAIVTDYLSHLVPCSYLALSHCALIGETEDNRPMRFTVFDSIYNSTSNPVVWRTPEEITRLFGGTELISPGDGQPIEVVSVDRWRPDAPSPMEGIERGSRDVLAGVGIV